ncbi:FadR/GntR family transcriptional regulator [Pseudonocardia kunmingensis]|uniref:GntR family transcriptional regulator n=1 Tax=Pseudonocardia kunmingensis TaxID=630975 RepID=A0A543DVG6_9PSEU|nr:FadR/GntR family transcriptional regulator [Pseudonocardia kunmingensis]TQM13318.1 GntR family transcriptional regulator [Pseudonocardia kunmingensis]
MSSAIRGGIEPVRRLKVADSVAEQLERMISRGDFKPGDKLPPERVLADQFGVGRSSMREAIRVVEVNGLLRSDHGVGVFVVSNSRRTSDLSQLLVLDEFTVPELFEVRITLERDSAGLAAKRITADEAAELQGIISGMADPDLSDEAFVSLDADLHRAIAQATKNRLLIKLHSTIEPLFVDYSHKVITLPGRREHAHAGHCAIVDAVVGRRVRDARTAAVRHIRDVERDIIAHLGQSGGENGQDLSAGR